ncbi:DODA-type extradiol aromatic ring-opening family dioxygenase [Pseudomonas sp. TTU2014-080ASC]|uniref:DODA-type extradiol aromatic ring-opening family dioxygenase n=1 Tax=Pseudomonas sp. TTU2014-080ASC TaxID=1729724 RepID=UPI000718356A|nr:class III extradiol ring-cleavage dioxygenase [Pseudomonas sp. TTU2014-080ASC]KRW61951.1 aromatic ring-opening dioxygenase LigB [Pseudomonas sp. TTU2014-080ASC]
MLMPSLFISHGSPMIALMPGGTGQALARLAAHLPRPKAIVVMSAHWESQDLRVSSSSQPHTWHDFGGFPPELYALQYPAPGNPQLADDIVQRLNDAGLPAKPDPQRPFDHGTWVPLRLMYPEANIPVVQVSLPSAQDTGLIKRIGEALKPLREQGILLIGSGSITHNLRDLDRFAGPEAVEPWAQAFRDWVVEKLQEGDIQALLDYRKLAPNAVRSHPSDEHFLPLYFALGAGDVFKIEHAGFTFATLGMDIYSFS